KIVVGQSNISCHGKFLSNASAKYAFARLKAVSSNITINKTPGGGKRCLCGSRSRRQCNWSTAKILRAFAANSAFARTN
ncbi:MAG: hypothetical protein ACYST6_19330, partial [Planctomycetota bacterium]